ncbi:hypothetical protein KUTeg_005888 [Tegillarca granosa]|uniref:Uncharacterized protein n=1 Tax=Tegillarca granosa TaxID=220873 RepID=A0ABQ9FGU6_TEGGR|nr:hypothetical protein KUTeg_005888 [Tegillarca granosa]
MLTAEATLQTPYRGYKNLRAALSHEELSNGNNKKIIGDLEVAIDPSIKFVASLLSPFRGFESMRTTMKT